MARMRKELKVYVVRALAVFNTPTEVIDLIKVNYPEDYEQLRQNKNGLKPQNIECYDPTKRAGSELCADLKAEFEATRKQFLDSPKQIPIANLTYRLERMQRIVDGASKNSVLQLKTLEQAAKDAGGAFTNRTEITGADGKPLEQKVYQLTPEAVDAIAKVLKDEY